MIVCSKSNYKLIPNEKGTLGADDDPVFNASRCASNCIDKSVWWFLIEAESTR